MRCAMFAFAMLCTAATFGAVDPASAQGPGPGSGPPLFVFNHLQGVVSFTLNFGTPTTVPTAVTAAGCGKAIIPSLPQVSCELHLFFQVALLACDSLPVEQEDGHALVLQQQIL